MTASFAPAGNEGMSVHFSSSGVAIIITNYLSLYGGTSHPVLTWVGIALMFGALALSTRWH